MGRRVQYKGTDAALKGAATFKKGAARHGGQARVARKTDERNMPQCSG